MTRGSDVQGILQAIYDKTQDLSGEVVVDKASDPQHPLHSHFEWDNSIAGHRYRVQQANALIRSVRLTYGQDDKGRNKSVRAFVVARRGADVPSGRYEPIEKVVADPLQRQMLLRDMRRDWLAFKSRYENLAEFADIVTSGGRSANTGS